MQIKLQYRRTVKNRKKPQNLSMKGLYKWQMWCFIHWKYYLGLQSNDFESIVQISDCTTCCISPHSKESVKQMFDNIYVQLSIVQISDSTTCNTFHFALLHEFNSRGTRIQSKTQTQKQPCTYLLKLVQGCSPSWPRKSREGKVANCTNSVPLYQTKKRDEGTVQA